MSRFERHRLAARRAVAYRAAVVQPTARQAVAFGRERCRRTCASQMRRGMLEHRVEHRLEFARRAADDLSISLVAVCCSSDSLRSSVRWRSSLSSRVFSMAITA